MKAYFRFFQNLSLKGQGFGLLSYKLRITLVPNVIITKLTTSLYITARSLFTSMS